MVADIHILLEKKVSESRWESTKERCKWEYQLFKKRLERLTRDDEIMMEATLDGSLEEAKNHLKEADSSSFWIEGPRNYLFFSILSGFRNNGYNDFSLDNTLYEKDEKKDWVKTINSGTHSDFHTPSIIYGDEIKNIINLIEELKQREVINKEELSELTLYFEDNFEEPLKRYTDKGYQPNELRFVLYYEF